jgi:hypothetical protein
MGFQIGMDLGLIVSSASAGNEGIVEEVDMGDGLEQLGLVREIKKPRAIVGVEGIYDLRALRDEHVTVGAYQEFIEGAFGKEEGVWDVVSPARHTATDGPGGFGQSWPRGRLAVIAHSMNDELVDLGQALLMKKALKGWQGEKEGKEILILDKLQGGHDEIWEKGQEMAGVIAEVVREIVRLDGSGMPSLGCFLEP